MSQRKHIVRAAAENFAKCLKDDLEKGTLSFHVFDILQARDTADDEPKRYGAFIFFGTREECDAALDRATAVMKGEAIPS